MWNRKLKAEIADLTEQRNRLLKGTAGINDELRDTREHAQRLIDSRSDDRQRYQVEIDALKESHLTLLLRLRTMRNAVEQFREVMIVADAGEPIAPPADRDTLDRLRDGLGIARDGSTVKRPQQW